MRHDPTTREDRILDDLALYNRYDCESTYGLREWLLGLRTQLERERNVAIPFFAGSVVEPPKQTADSFQDLKDRLDAAIPGDFDPESGDPQTEQIRPLWMARQMLEYHWREDKPVYWRFYDRCERYQEDPNMLLDDGEVLVQLEFVDSTPIGGRSKSVIERYRFPLQECKLDDGDCYSPLLKVIVGKIVAIEEDAKNGLLTISRGPKPQAHGTIEAIVARTIVPPGAIRTALAQFPRACSMEAPARGKPPDTTSSRAAHPAAGPRVRRYSPSVPTKRRFNRSLTSSTTAISSFKVRRGRVKRTSAPASLQI